MYISIIDILYGVNSCFGGFSYSTSCKLLEASIYISKEEFSFNLLRFLFGWPLTITMERIIAKIIIYFYEFKEIKMKSSINHNAYNDK